MILSHYSDAKPWTLRTSNAALYSQNPEGPWAQIGKPDGLWLSVDGLDDWARWCVGEDFQTARLAQRHVIEITEPNRIIMPDDLFAFTERYGSGDNEYRRTIDWQRV